MVLYTNDFFFLNGTHENDIDVITKKSALIIGFEIAKNFMDRYKLELPIEFTFMLSKRSPVWRMSLIKNV